MKRIASLLVVLLCAASRTNALSPPEISLWVARNAAPGPKVRLTINTRNLADVQVAAYRLDGIDWLLRRDLNEQKLPRPEGAPAERWSVRLESPETRTRSRQDDSYRSRQVNLPPLEPGIYQLVASGGGATGEAVVNITNLAVLVKRSPRAVIAWVTDARTGALLQGASVGLYQRDGKRIGGAETRADGLAAFPAGDAMDQVVIVRGGRDLAAVPVGVTDPDGTLTLHLQTDRPVYRPGQTVFYKAILRRTKGRGYTAVANTPCSVQVRDTKDTPISDEKVSTNALGTLEAQVDIPQAGTIGPYTVAIQCGKDTAYGQFTVAAYRKPEFQVAVKPEKDRYLAGEPLSFQVQARYYFGAPLPQAGVHYAVRRIPNPYGSVDESEAWYAGGDGNLYPHDTYFQNPFVAEGNVTTDADGAATITVQAQKDFPDSRYEVQCTVTDASRRQVEGSTGVPVYRAAKRISLSTDLLFTSLGSTFPVRVRAVDLDGNPTSARVTIIVTHPVWAPEEKRYRIEELARLTVNVPAAGSTMVQVPAKAEGSITVKAFALDGTGRQAEAEMPAWVASATSKPEAIETGPTLSVRLDRRSYRPGDTVRAWITTNTPDRPVLVAAEGLDIWKAAVLPAGRSGHSWSIPTSLAMSPNFSVTVSQWTSRGLVSGSALVKLPDTSRKLNVAVQPERTDYRPGDLARYTLKTTGEDGKPVPAEVAVSVVDEAIYAVRPDATPDPYTLFWGYRPNVVTTAFSAPEELSGGAYQRVNATAPVRQRFLDTALWAPRVTTGPDGTASFTVDIPGNLTTWRATAIAVTGDTRVGRTTGTIRVSRPVMLRLATPRQMVAGDRITLRGTINNRTDAPHPFEVMISAEGARIDGETTKRVTVPANGEAVVDWTLVADALPDAGQATLTARAIAADAPVDRGEEFSDVLRVPVRVVPNGVAETIRKGGLLAQTATATLALPPDRIEPASKVDVTVRVGLSGVVADLSRRLFASAANDTQEAADELLADASPGVNADRKAVREAVALLSRNQQGYGAWGWWENDPADPTVTAHALMALAGARKAGLPIPESMLRRAIGGASYMYSQTGLWEQRAQLAAAIALAEAALPSTAELPAAELGPVGGGPAPGAPPSERRNGPRLLEEVQRRGEYLSPYARLVMAEGLLATGNREAAQAVMTSAMASADVGPETAYVPAGERFGWKGTTIETTAQALIDLLALAPESDIAPKIARWLALPDQRQCWWCSGEDAAIVRALSAWLAAHPSPAQPGHVQLSVNGRPVEGKAGPLGDVVSFTVPRSLLRDTNNLAWTRDGEGEAFTSVEATVYRPAPGEAENGVRVLRRFEVQDANGVWNRVGESLPAAEPVRVTVVAWPDDRADALRLTEPLPAGFEFADSEQNGMREEVRDGAVIHEMRGDGRPETFRYFVRAESEGRVTALPATAEVLRRPALNGHTAPATLEVRP